MMAYLMPRWENTVDSGSDDDLLELTLLVDAEPRGTHPLSASALSGRLGEARTGWVCCMRLDIA